MALTTIAKIKSFLNIPSSVTGSDEWLDALRVAAEKSIKTYCKRDFEVATYTEYFSGNSTQYLTLKQKPVISVTSVHQDQASYFGTGTDPFPAASLLTQGVDYALDVDKDGISHSGILLRLNCTWYEVPRAVYRGYLTPEITPAFGSIKVVYSAGYSTIPVDLQYAVAYLVAFMRRTVPIGGVLQSETIGDYSYDLGRKPLPGYHPEIGTIRQLLSRYRDISV